MVAKSVLLARAMHVLAGCSVLAVGALKKGLAAAKRRTRRARLGSTVVGQSGISPCHFIPEALLLNKKKLGVVSLMLLASVYDLDTQHICPSSATCSFTEQLLAQTKRSRLCPSELLVAKCFFCAVRMFRINLVPYRYRRAGDVFLHSAKFTRQLFINKKCLFRLWSICKWRILEELLVT